MAAAGTESPDVSRKPIVNFSRPRLASKGQLDEEVCGIQRQDAPRSNSIGDGVNVKSVSAFHTPDPTSNDNDIPFPAEPRFSTDSETLTNTSLNSRRHNYDLSAARRGAPVGGLSEQRHPGPQRVESNGTTHTVDSKGGRSNSDTSRPSTNDSNKPLMPIKSILKQTSVEVSSERASSDGGEDTGSHHTVSDAGSSMVGYEKGGKWSSSDYDTSMLSEKEVEKLLKKGKNPALVAEMKAARKGKGIVGVMTGTSYVS